MTTTTGIYRVSFMFVFGNDGDRDPADVPDDALRVRAADAEDAIKRVRSAALEEYNSSREKKDPELKNIRIQSVQYITGVDI